MAKAYNNIATILVDKGDKKGAKKLFIRSLDIGKKTLGLYHPEVALDYYKKTDVDTKLTALFDRTTASSTGGINTKCGFKIAGADGREMIVNIMTITSSSVHNFAIPFTTGYNYSNSLEYNGGNFRGERLYFSTRTLTGVAISSFSGPVHCIFVGY